MNKNGQGPLIYGQPRPYFRTPSDTNYAQLFPTTGTASSNALVSSVIVTWIGGGDATIAINDGTTDHVILSAKTGSADDYLIFEPTGMILPQGYVLKVKTSAANQITFTANVQISTRNT